MSVLVSIVVVFTLLLGFAGCEKIRADRAEAALDQRNAEIEAEVARRRAEVSEWVVEASRRKEELGRKVEAAQAETRTVTREIIKEIPTYVTSYADSLGWVTHGFVRVHDAAALGTPLSLGAGGAADSASGVTPSAVAETIVRNYESCHLWREQVIGWQEWYATEKEKWNERAEKTVAEDR